MWPIVKNLFFHCDTQKSDVNSFSPVKLIKNVSIQTNNSFRHIQNYTKMFWG